MCKKLYPNLIHKKLEWMLYYSRVFKRIQPITRADSDLSSSTTWLSDRRNINACHSRDKCEERYHWYRTGAGKDLHLVDTTENPMVEGNAVKNFLRKQQTFCFWRHSVICQNLNFNNDNDKIRTNNTKYFYFIIIISHST